MYTLYPKELEIMLLEQRIKILAERQASDSKVNNQNLINKAKRRIRKLSK